MTMTPNEVLTTLAERANYQGDTGLRDAVLEGIEAGWPSAGEAADPPRPEAAAEGEAGSGSPVEPEMTSAGGTAF